MDLKTKYKILAQSTPENRNEYISLLWKSNQVPTTIRKFYIQKDLILAYNEKLLNLNRTCEQMYKDKQPITKIAKYYLAEKEAINSDREAIEKAFRNKRKKPKKNTKRTKNQSN